MTTPAGLNLGPKNITTAQLRAALRKHAGVFVLAARDLGCSRANVAQRVRGSEELQAFVAQIDAEIDDMANGIIVDTLLRKDMVNRPTKEAQIMARWLRDHKMRSRAVSIRLQAMSADGAPLPAPSVHVTVEYVDASHGADEEDDPI